MIPLFRPSCTDEEIAAVTRVMRSGWWTMGPETEAFEAEFAEYVHGKCKSSERIPKLHAAAVNSGTMALELAARTFFRRRGEIHTAIVPAFTFVSTALALKHAGYQVEFTDIDEDTLCLNWERVAEHVSQVKKQRRGDIAVAPVWYGGNVNPVPQDLLPWNVAILEDCAHAAGSQGAGNPENCNASAWSFHAVKNLACGDGGMVVSADADLIAKVKQLRWVGIDKSTYDRDTKRGYSWDYNITEDGEKAHMNDITAAIGRVQLRRLDDMNLKRRVIAREYCIRLAGFDWLRVPAFPFSGASSHLYTVRVPEDSRDKFIDHLRSKGVSAGVHYKPLYYYTKLFTGQYRPYSFNFPNTERVYRSIVTLPLFPDMTNSELDQVVSAVRSFKP